MLHIDVVFREMFSQLCPVAMATGGAEAAQHGDGGGLVADQRMGSAEGPGRDAWRPAKPTTGENGWF